MSQHVICLIASPLVHVTWGIVLAFNAMPMMVSGKPYVSISADHSEPGSRLKYAPNPYLKSQERTKSSLPSYFIILNNAKHNCAIPTYDKRVPPTPSPITPNETCMKWDSIRRQKLVAAATIQHLLSLLLLLLPQELKNAPPVAHLGEGELLVGDDGLPGGGPGRRRRGAAAGGDDSAALTGATEAGASAGGAKTARQQQRHGSPRQRGASATCPPPPGAPRAAGPRTAQTSIALSRRNVSGSSTRTTTAAARNRRGRFWWERDGRWWWWLGFWRVEGGARDWITPTNEWRREINLGTATWAPTSFFF